MYIHEKIIEAVIKIAKENELLSTVEIVCEMNKASYSMLEMPTIFDNKINHD